MKRSNSDLVDGLGEGKARDLLIRSIAAFLETNGFRKSLKALKSEANLEIDCWKSTSFNLESQFYKILELSNVQAKPTIDSLKEQDTVKSSKEKDGKESITKDAVLETKEKKRKKKPASDLPVENADEKQLVTGHGASESTNVENHLQKLQENKEKKKKKHKLPDSSDQHTETENEVTEKFREIIKDRIDELKCLSNNLSELDDKTEKKKKKKVKDVELEAAAVATAEDVQKTDKKKKRKTSSDVLSTAGFDHVEGVKSDDQKKRDDVNQEMAKSDPVNKNLHVTETNNVQTEKCSKKRKRSTTEGTVDAKLAAEESKVKSEDGGSNKEDNFHKVEKSNSEIEQSVDTKKRKTENSEKCSPETPTGNKTANGTVDTNGNEEGTFSKSMKKEKQSTERKSANPFQRVKIDEVEFVDDRLQDNSYWAKSGADSGYGAKAQEILGQVKGRDFRHEKTKKKRGSYRGGQIDFNSHSIKFNYSDEE